VKFLPVLFLLVANGVFLAAATVFTWDSIREKERRAVKVGFAAILAMIVLGVIILLFPGLRWFAGILLGIFILIFLLLLIPGGSNPRAKEGTEGYIVGEVGRVDERDIVFARNRSLPPGSEVYKRYYQMHPEREERDAKRRAAGGPLGRLGSIDGEHHPNLAMLKGTFHMPFSLGQKEKVEPSPEPTALPIDPTEATERIKGFARHLGADLVGVCRVDPRWAYSHRGEIFFDNWDDWGKEIPLPLPFAIVMAEEMDAELVRGAPHTPSVVESGVNYAKGAYISTIVANFIAHLGYPAIAHHLRHYDLVLVPLAVDAGLGELGRFGYLITEEFGPRVRLSAVTTSLPMVPDKPVDLGVQGFCAWCLKCADTCPSASIPKGGKVVFNGMEKWKLDEETCFGYWAKVGTDCNICMAVCPYSRPNRSIHRLTRWMVVKSPLARVLFPYVDNIVYGRKWHSGTVPSWIDYPMQKGA
jgi:reductive dehalogenase